MKTKLGADEDLTRLHRTETVLSDEAFESFSKSLKENSLEINEKMKELLKRKSNFQGEKDV